MTKSIKNLDLITELQHRGANRAQVTRAFELSDAVVTVAERGVSLVKRLLPMRPERGR